MTPDIETQWEACADPRLIHGLMREFFVWNSALTLSDGVSMSAATVVDVQEPEDAAASSPRTLRLRLTAPPPAGRLSLSGQAGARHVRWRADLVVEGDEAVLPIPDRVETWIEPWAETEPSGPAVVSVFCHSGAITGPFIRAQSPAIRAFADRWSDPWPPTLLSRWVETDASGRIIGHVCASRMGDGLHMITDVARTRPPGGASGRGFIAGAIRDLAHRLRDTDPDALVLLSWGPGHPLWAPFEQFLAEAGSAHRVAATSTLYTRFSGARDQPPSALNLTVPTATEAARHLEGVTGADARRFAAALGVGEGTAPSPLAQALAAAGEAHDRAVVLVARETEPVAVALFTGLPPTWNLRKTCNCVWLFPLEAWRPADRPAVYAALHAAPWAGAAPGVLEVTAVSGEPGPGKWLDWKMVDCAALAYFEAWAA